MTGFETNPGIRPGEAVELERQFPGWHVWQSGKVYLATRRGHPPNSSGSDAWARTVMADSWDELAGKLAVQARIDTDANVQAPAEHN
jgi:hypothetical protein